MPSLLIKDLPSEIHLWLKQEAEANRRSMTQQALVVFEERMHGFQTVRFPPPVKTKTVLTDEFFQRAKRSGRP